MIAVGPRVLLVACLCGLAACAGSGGDGDGAGPGNGGPKVCNPKSLPTPTVLLSSNVQPILTASCAVRGCHDGSVQFPPLTAGRTRAATVNVKARQVGRFDYVEPGNADTSYLVIKIENAPGVSGAQMPPGCPGAGQNGAACVSDSDLAAIRQWIAECAQDN